MNTDKFGRYVNSGKVDFAVQRIYQKRPIGGFTLTANADLDVCNKRIKNVATPLDEQDVVNKIYLDRKIEKLTSLITTSINTNKSEGNITTTTNNTKHTHNITIDKDV